jgi:Bacterial regulatory protein, Fis family
MFVGGQRENTSDTVDTALLQRWAIPTFLSSPARERVLASFVERQIKRGCIDELLGLSLTPIIWQIAKQLKSSLAADKIIILLEKMLSQAEHVAFESIELMVWHIVACHVLTSNDSLSKSIFDYCLQRFEHHMLQINESLLDEEKCIVSVAVARETSIILDHRTELGTNIFVRRYVDIIRKQPKARQALASAVVEYYGTVPTAFERIVAHLKAPERYGLMVPIEILELTTITERYHKWTADFRRRLRVVCRDLLIVITRIRNAHHDDSLIGDLTYEAMETIANAFWTDALLMPESFTADTLQSRSIESNSSALQKSSSTLLVNQRQQTEKEKILEAIVKNNGRRDKAALYLGIPLRTLYYQMKKLCISETDINELLYGPQKSKSEEHGEPVKEPSEPAEE